VYKKSVVFIAKEGKFFPVPQEKPINYFGYLEGTATAEEDIIAPLDLEWDAVLGPKPSLHDLKGILEGANVDNVRDTDDRV
jgi:hypothetical protein